jgi:hypothetical protein
MADMKREIREIQTGRKLVAHIDYEKEEISVYKSGATEPLNWERFKRDYEDLGPAEEEKGERNGQKENEG